jgi:hypothetical protein
MINRAFSRDGILAAFHRGHPQADEFSLRKSLRPRISSLPASRLPQLHTRKSISSQAQQNVKKVLILGH